MLCYTRYGVCAVLLSNVMLHYILWCDNLLQCYMLSLVTRDAIQCYTCFWPNTRLLVVMLWSIVMLHAMLLWSNVMPQHVVMTHVMSCDAVPPTNLSLAVSILLTAWASSLKGSRVEFLVKQRNASSSVVWLEGKGEQRFDWNKSWIKLSIQ